MVQRAFTVLAVATQLAVGEIGGWALQAQLGRMNAGIEELVAQGRLSREAASELLRLKGRDQGPMRRRNISLTHEGRRARRESAETSV
jgi:hypothetical protein